MKSKKWTKASSCAMLVLLSLLVSQFGSVVQAATATPRVNVSRDDADSISPRSAQDSDGNIHVVWVSVENERVVRYAKGVWNGSNYTFGGSAELARVGSFQFATPSIAVSPNGTVMAAWSASDGVRIRSWNGRDNGPSGGAVHLGGGIQSSVAADNENRFHIAWNGDFQIQYCEWDGSACRKRDSFSEGESNRPDITVDSANNVHLVWDRGQGVKYRNRPAGGEWNAIENIGGGNFAQIAADGQGNVHIVRSDNFDIQYCRRTLSSGCANRTFDAADDLAPSVGANGRGDVLVAFRTGESKTLWYNAFENGAWGSSRELDSGPTAPDVSARSYTNRFSVSWSIDFEAQMRTLALGSACFAPSVAATVGESAAASGTVGTDAASRIYLPLVMNQAAPTPSC